MPGFAGFAAGLPLVLSGERNFVFNFCGEQTFLFRSSLHSVDENDTRLL